MAIRSQFNSSTNFGEMYIADFLSAGLLKPSLVKPIITTIEKSLVIRKLGKFKDADCQNLQQLIQLIIG
jgi:mRNA interferase MazF